MTIRKTLMAAIGVAALSLPTLAATTASAEEMHHITFLGYRSGPFAVGGAVIANGYGDYIKMINARDGGINGVKVVAEECETGYATPRGVECYERLKGSGSVGTALVQPNSTGITYALLDKSRADKIPVMTMGFGRTDAANGAVFPYVFPIVATYWSQATAIIKFIAAQEGGYDKLKGKKIAHLYLESAYGKEPIPIFNQLGKQHGFSVHEFPVPFASGSEQKAVWLQISRRLKPDYVVLWGWGVMNATAIKEAIATGYPLDHMIGNWWSASEQDVVPSGAAAKGFRGVDMMGVANYPVHKDILKHVHDAKNSAGPREHVGQVLYNRGMLMAALSVESIRTAMEKFGNKPMSGEQTAWGMENLDLTAEKLANLGFKGAMAPVKLSCSDHEGGGRFLFKQWDGSKFVKTGDWLEGDASVVRPLIEKSSMQYAKEKKITPRKC